MAKPIRLAVALVTVTLAAAAFAASAMGFSSVNAAWHATAFATGFASNASSTGPTGATMGPDGRTYVTDFKDGNVYRFPHTGGTASAATKLTPVALTSPVDIQFTADHRLWVTQEFANKVSELNTATGKIVPGHDIAVTDPAGLAVDPLSGDLFVSEYAPGKVVRVHAPGTAAQTVTDYTTGLSSPDGLAFGAHGTLYVSDNVGSNADIFRVDGTDTATKGAKHGLVTFASGGPDGIIVGSGYILVDRNDGVVTKVLTSAPFTKTDIASGGSRGDTAKAGSDGCGYLTQTSTVVKLTAANGSCSLRPAVRFDAAPVATTKPATGVTRSSATLHALVNPNGPATKVHFVYSKGSSSASKSTPTQTLSRGTSAKAVAATVKGLAPGTTYRFHIVATNAQGTRPGTKLKFTTGP